MSAARRNADWQAVLSDAVRDPAELCRLLRLPRSLATAAQRAAEGFDLLVPRTFLGRIQRGDPSDPLLVQVLPQAAELAETPRFQTDPLGEADAVIGPGLLHKYQGRSLIVTTPTCAVHCRFCFRRHFPYFDVGEAIGPGLDTWAPVLDRIAADPSIREVILSGGDPLTLPDEYLAQFAKRLSEIAHLVRLRLHTRLPVMVPQRVTDELLGWMRGTRLTPIMVIHVNHPAEIDHEVAAAFRRMIEAGVPVLSQSVLLAGVNDEVDVLAELYGRLVDLGVMPYYLHQLDRVAGAAHFEVPEAIGVELIAQLRTRLPGYAVPRYVRERCGGPSKEVLA